MPQYGSCIVSGVFKFTVFSVCWLIALTCTSVRPQVPCRRFHVLLFLQDVPKALLTFCTAHISFHQSQATFSILQPDKLRQRRSALELARRKPGSETKRTSAIFLLWVTLAVCPTLTILLTFSVDFLKGLSVSRVMFFRYLRNSAFTFNDGSC